MTNNFNRRDFFKIGFLSGTGMLFSAGHQSKNSYQLDYSTLKLRDVKPKLPSRYGLDLQPARWIWYPSQRTLPNTFILFRKSFEINKEFVSAQGWILGDSRYLLTVNGQRIQWGPTPSDPRFSEADPLDLSGVLKKGENVIGANVLYYGFGDGTWPVGKPGFIFYLEIKYKDGSERLIISDNSWKSHLARSWKPGQYKRWYLRSLQEEFDAREYPYGWDMPGFEENDDWLESEELRGNPQETVLSSSSSDYMYNSSSGSTATELRKRSIPMLLEKKHSDLSLEEVNIIDWKRPSREYFEMVVPEAYRVVGSLPITSSKPWTYNLKRGEAVVFTFSAPEQMVGWPYFKINATKGTTVELMVQEAHRLHRDGGPAIMNNHFHSWTRFICKEGDNNFETFDFESIKWIQLHVHGGDGEIEISDVGIRRRTYDWAIAPVVKTSDKNLQKILDACINTIYNNSQETIVDGMGRERQQYSGDIGHVLHVLYRVFGEKRLPARYLNTYSQGLTKDGFFLDCWPAYDRLNRLAQRQLDLTQWGPLLDHGVGFNFDCFHHFLYTGELDELVEVWPRLLRFYEYLNSIVDSEGLLPVENIGIPAVWIDHDAYKEQRHKQCAFNLYAVAMLHHALVPLMKAMNRLDMVGEAHSFGDELLTNTIKKYWDSSKKLFICNKPWISQEGEERMCDRSLATAIIFDLAPNGRTDEMIDVLINPPDNLGRSYPPNANWYLWALGKAGQVDAIIRDFDDRWIGLDSIHQNNTMQESWHATPDSSSQWSHASIAPLITVFSDIAGIQSLSPGYEKFRIKPECGKYEYLELNNHTPAGPIFFSMTGKIGGRRLLLKIPKGISGELILDERENVKLNELGRQKGKKILELKGGDEIDLKLKYS